jgi:flotillin
MATTEQDRIVLFCFWMMKTVPPLNDLFNMAGLNLPTYLKGEDKVEKITLMIKRSQLKIQ